MKSTTVTRDVFTFAELLPPEQDRALEIVRTVLYDVMEYDQITDHLNGDLYYALTGTHNGEISTKELAKDVGLTVKWSLSHCQGDGVAIYGTVYASDAPKLEWHGAHNARLTPNSWATYYSHYNTFDVVVSSEDEDGNYTTLTGDIVENITKQFRDICRELARSGYAEIEYSTSSEMALQFLDSHLPRRFNKDGTYAPTSFWGEQ